jgi:hypothetical protein
MPSQLEKEIVFYAARNWVHHARATLTEVEQLILDFLKSEAKVSATSQAIIVSEKYRYGNYNQKSDPDTITRSLKLVRSGRSAKRSRLNATTIPAVNNRSKCY